MLISRHRLESLAKELKGFVPSALDPFLVIAASAPLAIRLRGDSPEATSFHLQALGEFLRELQKQPNPERKLREMAADFLGDPSIVEVLDRKQEVLDRIANAHADLAAIENEKFDKINHRRGLENQIRSLSEARRIWEFDFTGNAERARELIRNNYAQSISTPGAAGEVDRAFKAIQRAPLMAEIAKEELARIDRQLERLGEEFRKLDA